MPELLLACPTLFPQHSLGVLRADLGSLVPAGAHLRGSPSPISIPECPGHGVWEASFLGSHLGQHLNCTDRRNELPERKQKSKAFAEPPMPKKSPGEERESSPFELCGRPCGRGQVRVMSEGQAGEKEGGVQYKEA